MKALLLVFLTFVLIGCGSEGPKSLELIDSSIVVDANRIWPSGYTIPIAVYENDNELKSLANYLKTTPLELNQELKEVMDLWMRYANLNFEFVGHRSNLTKEQKTGPYVVITFTIEPGRNWANVGPSMPSVGGYNMSLGGLGFTSFLRKATMAHEFGHLMGFRHEHQHPQRKIAMKDLYANCKNSGFTQEQCKGQMYRTYNDDEQFILLPYDSTSIMHYEFEVTEPEVGLIGTTNYLSLMDKVAAVRLYPGKVTDINVLEKMHNEDLILAQKDAREATDLSKCYLAKPKSCAPETPFNIVSKLSGKVLLRKCLGPSTKKAITVLNSIDFCH